MAKKTNAKRKEAVVETKPMKEGKVTTSSKIRELFAQGKSRSEIAKELGIRYQHVRNVLITPVKSKAA